MDRGMSRFARAVLFLLCVGATGGAGAVDGCKVLLCLASPGGPRQFDACVPPINDLFKSLAMGDAFPSCTMAGSPGSPTGAYAAPMPANYYDQCPAGTSALASGSYAIMAPNWVPADNNRQWVAQQALYVGIGEGTNVGPPAGLTSTSMPPKVCVAGEPLGRVRFGRFGGFGGRGWSPQFATVYKSVTILQPNSSPNVIGVWVNGALYNQVHW